MENKQKILLTLSYVKSIGHDLYERPCTHDTNTGLQTAKNITRPIKTHHNALETIAVYHSKSCYSINMLHESTVDAASGDDR